MELRRDPALEARAATYHHPHWYVRRSEMLRALAPRLNSREPLFVDPVGHGPIDSER